MMDDDSTLGNESGPAEPMLVEVEILDARGLDQDPESANVLEDAEQHWYYEASMQLVSSLTGEPIRECGIQWVRLRQGRRMTFMTPRCSPDRFVFGGVTASSLLAVRFDVFKKAVVADNSSRGPGSCRLIGVAEVTPWIVVKDEVDEESRYCRWVRLVEDTTQLGGRRGIDKPGSQGLFGARQRRGSGKRNGGTTSSSSSSSLTAVRQPRSKRQRSEIRVAVTSRVGSGDALADALNVADAKPRWFLAPKPAVDPANVVRIAVIRSSEVLSANAVVAARLSANIEEVDDPSMFFANAGSAAMVAVTRASSLGVWMQTLELAVPPKLAHLHKDAFFVDVAIMHRVVTGGGRNDGELLLRRAVIPMANVLSDEPCWIDFKPNVSLKLALRWDYNEALDPRESRPFFDAERFELKAPVPPVVGKKEKKRSSCNAVRIVLARGRNPPPTLNNHATSARGSHGMGYQPPLLTPGAKFCARVHLQLGGLIGLAPAPQASAIRTVGPDGVVVWNECFEFVFPQESSAAQTSIKIELIPLVAEGAFGEQQQPALSAMIDAPRDQASRKWYDVVESNDSQGGALGGAQLQVLATRFYDSTLNQEDMRSIVTEALSFAFPEVDLRSIERVYDSTKDVADACVALSSLTASTERDSDIDSTMFVASCNATDLSWAIMPITEEKQQDISNEDDNNDDEEEEDKGSRKSAADNTLPVVGEGSNEASSQHLGESKTPDSYYEERRRRAIEQDRRRRLIKSTTAIMLTKNETIRLIRNHPVGSLKISIVNGDASSSVASDDNDSSVAAGESKSEPQSPSDERRRLLLKPDGHFFEKKKKNRTRRTTVRVSATLEDYTERVRSVSVVKIDVAVDRTPRDFVTLRTGLVAKLGLGNDAIPPLPKWVAKALRLKLKAQRVSIATGVTTASIAAAVAVATGVVAPVLIVPGAVGIGLAMCSTSQHITKAALQKEVQRELAQSTFLADVARTLSNNTRAVPDRLNDAILFFKQFMAHGAMCTMHPPPKRKHSSLTSQGSLADLLGDDGQEETKDGRASLTKGVSDMSISSGNSLSGNSKAGNPRSAFARSGHSRKHRPSSRPQFDDYDTHFV